MISISKGRKVLAIVTIWMLGSYLVHYFGFGLPYHLVWTLIFIFCFYFKTSEWVTLFLIRIGLPIIVALYFAIAYEHANTTFEIYNFIVSLGKRTNIDLYYISVATIYAITIAFVLFKGMQDFTLLRSALQDEADKIHSILELLAYFQNNGTKTIDDTIMDIKRTFHAYLTSVIDEKNDYEKNEDAENELLRQVIDHVCRLKVEDNNDYIALDRIIGSIDELFMIKSRRIVYTEMGISPYLLGTLVVLSVCIILPLYLDLQAWPSVNHVLIFSLSLFISLFFIMLIDINSPFDGYWKVRADAFRKLDQRLLEELKAEDLRIAAS